MTTKKHESRSLAALLCSWLAAAVFAALPGAGSAQLVSGLAGASGSTVGPDGSLYVTEGAIGQLTRVNPRTGARQTVASGLPPSIAGIGGATDVAFLDGTPYVLVTLVGDPLFGAPFIDGIYRVDSPVDFTLIADLGSWSATHPPTAGFDYFLVNGVQYAIETFRGGFLVTDGHLNRVLRVELDGSVSEYASFDNIVPTGLEARGRTVYMAEAGPAPHHPEDGKVIAIDAKSGEVNEIASGAELPVDVELGPGNRLYVLAQGFWDGVNPGDPAVPFTGSLVRVNENGTVTELLNSLNLPTSLEFIGNTAYVVTLTGEIWALPGAGHPVRHGH